MQRKSASSVGRRGGERSRKGAQSFSLPFTYRRLERRASACSLPRLPLQISAVRAPGDFASYGPVSALAFCVRAILLIACELSAIVQFDTLLYVYCPVRVVRKGEKDSLSKSLSAPNVLLPSTSFMFCLCFHRQLSTFFSAVAYLKPMNTTSPMIM